MRRFLTRRPAPGTVLGLVALFVALGGVAFAQGTTTPGTTTTTTPAGPPPVAEAIHAQSASRAPLQRVVYVTETHQVPRNRDPNSENIAVSCPGEMKVIGGGLTTEGAGGSRDFELRYSGPTSESSWEIVYNPGTDDAGETVRGTAICADVVETTSQGALR